MSPIRKKTNFGANRHKFLPLSLDMKSKKFSCFKESVLVCVYTANNSCFRGQQILILYACHNCVTIKVKFSIWNLQREKNDQSLCRHRQSLKNRKSFRPKKHLLFKFRRKLGLFRARHFCKFHVISETENHSFEEA